MNCYRLPAVRLRHHGDGNDTRIISFIGFVGFAVGCNRGLGLMVK